MLRCSAIPPLNEGSLVPPLVPVGHFASLPVPFRVRSPVVWHTTLNVPLLFTLQSILASCCRLPLAARATYGTGSQTFLVVPGIGAKSATIVPSEYQVDLVDSLTLPSLHWRSRSDAFATVVTNLQLYFDELC